MKVLGYLRQHAYTSPFLCKRYIRDGPHHNNFSDLFPIVTGFNGLAHLGAGYHRGFFFFLFPFWTQHCGLAQRDLITSFIIIHITPSYPLYCFIIHLLKGSPGEHIHCSTSLSFSLGTGKIASSYIIPNKKHQLDCCGGIRGVAFLFFFFSVVCTHARTHLLWGVFASGIGLLLGIFFFFGSWAPFLSFGIPWGIGSLSCGLHKCL